MAGATGMPGWQDMARGAPELARLGLARLDAARLALLGTLRRDGSPRISPVEPLIAGGQLLIGAMTWSAKVADVRRDPRYVLHSVVSDPDNGAGELKLYGSAVVADPDLRASSDRGWWAAWPPDKAVVFCLSLAQAVFVEWDTGAGLMTVHRWSPGDGYAQSARTYP